MDIVPVPAPAEPEQASRERDGPDNCRRETPFRYGLAVVRFELAPVRALQGEHVCTAHELADDQADECQSTYTNVHPVHLLEDNRVRAEQGIHKPIHKRDIQRDQKQNWLGDEHLQRPREVVPHKFHELHLNLILLRMYPPIMRLPPQDRSLVHQYNRRIRLVHETKRQHKAQKDHDRRDIMDPPPA